MPSDGRVITDSVGSHAATCGVMVDGERLDLARAWPPQFPGAPIPNDSTVHEHCYKPPEGSPPLFRGGCRPPYWDPLGGDGEAPATLGARMNIAIEGTWADASPDAQPTSTRRCAAIESAGGPICGHGCLCLVLRRTRDEFWRLLGLSSEGLSRNSYGRSESAGEAGPKKDRFGTL